LHGLQRSGIAAGRDSKYVCLALKPIKETNFSGNRKAYFGNWPHDHDKRSI